MRRPGNEKGSGVIEFSLSAFFLILTATGVFQFGYAAHQYSAMLTRVADAARYASRLDCTRCTSGGWTAFNTNVKNYAVFGNPQGAGSPALYTLTTGNIEVVPRYVDNDPARGIDTVTVRVNSFVIDAAIKQFQIQGKPAVTMQYAAYFSP